MKSILILGVGNISRKDDGIGVHVINYILGSNINIPPDVDIVEVGSAIYDLLPIINGRRKVVIVDALKTDDIPGTVYRIPSENLKAGFWNILRMSPELREVIFQCYIVSGNVAIDLIGIVPADIDTCAIDLSFPVSEKIHYAASEAIKAAVIT